ncbi:MAG: A/G-specific adenine glycosylase [Chloroflexi bacterium]|nr:A/G-specific adenine glycosylase [Chloroflexota bacterium]
MGRDLPWRRTRDPYAILVSEIMLQQTQVERVKPRYEQFLDAFPTLARLAAAPLADVIRVWAGLGYNRRAVRLHQIAVQVTKRPDGRLPDTPDALRQLDGLGSYTANAVACFAFGQQVPVVDTNVRRVLGRVFADVIGLDPPAGHSLDGFASQVLPAGQAYAWNSALMDLGATVCTARNPDHAACPLAPVCVGRSLLPSRATRQRAAEPGLPPQVRSDSAVRPYNRQPFEQTTRFFRGRIVDRLRALPHGGTLGLDALGAALRPDYLPDEHRSWVAGLVERLRRDGLVATCDDSGTLRVSLP